jgi:hypothetical protein
VTKQKFVPKRLTQINTTTYIHTYTSTVERFEYEFEIVKMQGSSESTSMVIETLKTKGWYLEETDDLKAIIVIQTALADDSSNLLESVESELLNSDLRSIGSKSLPEPSLLRNNPSSFLHGPKVLQVN